MNMLDCCDRCNLSSRDKNGTCKKSPRFFHELLYAATKGFSSGTYVIDINTYDLTYVNNFTKKRHPNAQEGRKCYQSFFSRSEPCENCHAEQLLKSGENHLEKEVFFEDNNSWSKLELFVIEVCEKVKYMLVNSYDITSYKHLMKDESGNGYADVFTKDIMLYNALTKSTEDYIFMCDMESGLFCFPEKFVEEFEMSGQVIANFSETWSKKIHENDRNLFLREFHDIFEGKSDTYCQEYRALNKNGEWVWVRCKGYVEKDQRGRPALFAGLLKRLGTKGKIDHMSGLQNKYEFEVKVCELLEEAQGDPVGIMILGIDNFKHINNLYSWDFGDNVIRIYAQTIQALIPKNTYIFRLDGDMFGLIMKDASEEAFVKIHEKLNAAFNKQQMFEGNRYYCTISAGCAIAGDDWISFYTLFMQAECALEYAKSNGKNRVNFYSEDSMSGKDRSLSLIDLLYESVNDNFRNFELHYQPQVDAMSCEVKSAEALLRWKCEKYGNVSPVEVIPLLEQTGLIHIVGRWVLREAAKTCKDWRKIDPNFKMSINLSYLQLLEEDFIGYIKTVIDYEGLPTSAIHVEITESRIASGSKSLSSAFNKIRALGLRIEMDDFGTGYSSLEILKNEPADVVKIDRAFVKNITNSDFDATFIRFVVALCHSVNILVCLEGVEHWDEYELVKLMDIDIIQGYLFGKPQSKEDFELNFLNQKHRSNV